MKKWIISSVILVIILFANKANGQTYTQTFIDKCTGETKVVTTTYINGNAVVSFYNQIKTFTPLEVQIGQLQVWLQTTYQISKRFVFAIDWKLNASTVPESPILNFFMVGTRSMF